MRRILIALSLLSPLAALAAPANVPPPPTIQESAAAQAEPEVRIIQKSGQKIEEYRMNGKLYAIKVTPKIGLPYYLVDEDGSGKMNRIGQAICGAMPSRTSRSFRLSRTRANS